MLLHLRSCGAEREGGNVCSFVHQVSVYVYTVDTHTCIQLLRMIYLLLNAAAMCVVCERFLAEMKPWRSEVVDDPKYYEISVKPTVYNAHNVLEHIYDHPDLNPHVSLGMMCIRQLMSMIAFLIYM